MDQREKMKLSHEQMTSLYKRNSQKNWEIMKTSEFSKVEEYSSINKNQLSSYILTKEMCKI